MRAKKWLFKIVDVHKEQIESHHGEEREDGQARAKASPEAARVQADPVNKPVEDQRKNKHRTGNQMEFKPFSGNLFHKRSSCFVLSAQFYSVHVSLLLFFLADRPTVHDPMGDSSGAFISCACRYLLAVSVLKLKFT